MNQFLESILQPWVWAVDEASISLTWPVLLLMAPLPPLLAGLRRPFESRFESLHAPLFDAIARATGAHAHAQAVVLRRSRRHRAVQMLCWLALLVAAARPLWTEAPLTRIVPRRDILLALDLSQSMEAADVPTADGKRVERLAAAKWAIDDFIAHRAGDRIGLVAFANRAHLLAPFTEDHALVRELLAETHAGMAGPQTRVGDAIGLGIKLFEASRAPRRVMVLLTDGADTGSRIPPEMAARIARERDLVIHTVALGQPGNTQDKVDVATLKKIADATHGQFAQASGRDDLQQVYAQLDAVETRNHVTLTHRPQRELFHWPLAAAVLLQFALLAWGASRASLDRWRARRIAKSGNPSHA